jgi:putative tryptophan/tyrosine transport system substrate-binding protein
VIRPSRRQFVQGVSAMGLALLAGCGRWPGQAPPADKAYRLALLTPQGRDQPASQAFLEAMRASGYEDGRDLAIEWRATNGRTEGLADHIAELIRGQPDVMVTGSNPPSLAAKAATSTIPIVFVSISDPVGEGLVASLARPGGNATGLSNLATGLAAKRLELLKATAPTVARVGVLWVTASDRPNLQLREVRDAAEVLGIEVRSLEVRGLDDLGSALEAASRARVDALYVITNPLLSPARVPEVYEFVARNRLPLVSAFRQDVEAGGLMAYGVSFFWLYQRAAYYVDRILKGAKPADLPVEQPTTFDFVINAKTALALGLTIPHHVLLQATEVIQ